MRLMLAALAALVYSSVASAAEDKVASDDGATSATMGSLVADGFEIKAAVQNGKKFVVFLQKNSTAYACEMASLSRSQCGKIN